jgi:hypothetical protein
MLKEENKAYQVDFEIVGRSVPFSAALLVKRKREARPRGH